MKKVLLLGLVFVLLVLPALPAGAQAPTSQQIPFSGTAPGQLDAPTDLTFNLFDAATGGTFLGYTDSQVGVQVTAEAFSAVLGAGTGGPVSAGTFANNPSVFIAIELTSAPGVEIGPRVPLFSSGYAQFALTGGSGTISGVTAGPGLSGGGTSGNVTLSANFAGSGIANSVARSDHNHDAQYSQLGHTHAGSDITSPVATANNALAIADNTVTSAKIVDGSVGAVDVNSAEVQLRVTGTCAVGNAIRVVNLDGTVTCQSVGSVTAVTTSAPLASSGGATPNISLPSVIIGSNNTAIGLFAFQSNTIGVNNTASGAQALLSNTTGDFNTASGTSALVFNTTGSRNTASGVNALSMNTTGSTNTASGVGALQINTTGDSNTASGRGALFFNTTGNNNTALGF